MASTALTENDSKGVGKIKDLSVKLTDFYGEVRTEMKKVTHPSWKEVRGTTLVVLATVAIFGVFFYIVDSALTKGVEMVIQHFSK